MEKILENIEIYELPGGLKLELGNPQNFFDIFNANIKKNGELIGTLGNFRFIDYNPGKNKFFSYLLAIDIEAKHKGKGYATTVFEGLIEIIKNNYSDSAGLLIDKVNSSQGNKYLPRIAKKLKEKKSITNFVYNHCQKRIFLEF
jgi:hypothetical protein